MRRWTCCSLLKSNAEELEELALFYRSQGYFLAATLIGAAALSIRQNVGEIEPGHGGATCSTK
jgi:cytosine/adenosine deaminase-related metal-dependent hydrolase